MIYNSVLENIGKTPVFKLNHLCNQNKQSEFSIYIKDESYNPGGSHKTRVAYNLIKDAERQGRLKPNTGQTIIEPTGGNTGKGLAIAGNLLGYKVILVIPNNYSRQKQKMLKNLGAEVISPNSNKEFNSHGELAITLLMEHPEYVMLNQMNNPANPEIHKLTTGLEILEDFQNINIDYFVAGIGTGGHITAIGQMLKEVNPEVKIIGVQPSGCEILNNKFTSHQIQGISVGVKPKVLNPQVIDRMISVTFEEALVMMQELTKKESLLVGLSSGANMAAVLKILQELKQHNSSKKHINILTMAYDSLSDYLDLLD